MSIFLVIFYSNFEKKHYRQLSILFILGFSFDNLCRVNDIASLKRSHLIAQIAILCIKIIQRDILAL